MSAKIYNAGVKECRQTDWTIILTMTSSKIGLLAIFALGAMIPATAFAALPWQDIVPDSVSVNENVQTTKLSLSAADTIPISTDELAGFAWLYDGSPNTAFAITIHDADLDADGKNDVRDSLQNPDGWHAHNVILASPPEDADESTTLCIEEISDAPNSGISFSEPGTDVTVNVRNSQLTGNFTGAAVAFSIVVDPACPVTFPTEDVVPPNGLTLGIVVHD